MLKEEQGSWFRRLFYKGARPDVTKELLGDGFYEDAMHMRLNSVDGASGSLEHMGGEELLWSIDDPLGYECIGAEEVSGDEVAFWCHPNGVVDPDGFPPIVTVGSIVMARSPRIPYRFDRKLQFGDVSRCAAGHGVLFPADHSSDALFWDVADMRTSFFNNSQRYFNDFNPLLISVLPAGPREWFEFTGLQVTGIGMPPGTYIYWGRFNTPTGDRTNPGPPTPPITVPRTLAPMYEVSAADGQYPGGQSSGAPAAAASSTGFAIKLQWQVDNPLGFTELEIVRQRFNEGQGINGDGIVEVVGRIPISVGQLGIIEFIDPVDSNFLETIPPDVAAQQIIAFTAPKTVEHLDNRLMYANVTFQRRAPQLEWNEVDGQRTVPITNRVFTWYEGGNLEYNDGHADPVNACYVKGALHNERYGIGAMLWDGYAGSSFVDSIEADKQMPDRRDVKDGNSLNLSYNQNAPYGTSIDPIYAANNNCQDLSAQGIPYDPVSPTFDAIVQGQKTKTDDSFTNIINGFNYNPFRPSSPSDPNFIRYRQKPVTQWGVDGALQPENNYSFAPQQHVLGTAIYGPSNIDTEAPWWEIMDVMVTPPADRVVAEGIACYDLNGYDEVGPVSNPIYVAKKTLNSLRCHFPDIDSGLVPPSIADEINANPGRYKLKLVPVGFGEELYSYASMGTSSLDPDAGGSLGCDIINYMDVQLDHGVAPYSVNIGTTPSSQGVQPSFSAPLSPTNYVGYSSFRDTCPQGITDPSNADYSIFLDPNNTLQGNYLFALQSAEFVDEGRGQYLRIITQERIYRLLGGINPQADFTDALMRKFHEPYYIVQIIRDGATVPQRNIQDYRSTGYRVARERTIALGQASGQQWTAELFHARVEDCVTRPGSGQLRYVYVREQGQPDKRWLCFTNAPLTALQFAAAIAAFNAGLPWTDPDGNDVWGAYSYAADNTGSTHIKHNLTFGQYGSYPAQGARVIVKYDDRSPLRAFNLDGCTVAPAVFSPLDRTFSRDIAGASSDTSYLYPPPLPYQRGQRASNYELPQNPSNGVPADLTEPVNFGLGYGIQSIRQWVIYGHATTRTPLRLCLGDPGDDGAFFRGRFPARHYVMRPTDAASGLSALNPSYSVDYPGEENYFRMGGFWVVTDWNLDYAKRPPITGKGYPLNNVLPVSDGCNYHVVSLRRVPGQVDTPGFRTFLSDNVFPISDETGGIMRIAGLDQSGYQQLYGWTERGLYRIPYNKNILVGADGNTVGTQSVSEFWPREEIWLVRGSKGMPDQMWRLSAKVSAPAGSGDMDTMVWTDRTGAYQLAGGQVRDLLRGKYASKLLPLLATIPAGQEQGTTSVFNRKNGEWWMSMALGSDGREPVRSFVFSVINGEWVGQHRFSYDQYVANGNGMTGYRRLGANAVGVGYSFLNSADQPVAVELWAETVFIPFPFMQSEAIKWRIGPDKPDEMRVFDRNGVEMLRTSQAIQEAFEPGTGQYWVLNIDSWEQMVGNVSASYDPTRSQPPQSTGFFIRWYFRRQEPIRLAMAMLQCRMIA